MSYKVTVTGDMELSFNLSDLREYVSVLVGFFCVRKLHINHKAGLGDLFTHEDTKRISKVLENQVQKDYYVVSDDFEIKISYTN